MECHACPLECGADRTSSRGACNASERIEVALAQLHHWEEPPISGTLGSGTIFFSHCNLHCRFCQNYDISQLGSGVEMPPERLSAVMFRLRDQGAHNINLVSPTQYTNQLIPVLEMTVPRLGIPVVWNSNGYEKVETLRRLEGLVQVYLPDFKYFSDELAMACSAAPGYSRFATDALLEMLRQVGQNRYDDNGIIKRGMIVRHLVLPGHVDDSIRVLGWLHEVFGPSLQVSLMVQYCPVYLAGKTPGLNRRLTVKEYERVLREFERLGFENGYCQDVSSATSEYTPDFDGSGL
uniref:Radical SAM protein n=1 Tax=candidate division WOR-3 bacterium TaxID=2052148 RepID=A0A7C4CAN3_UNCW3